MSEPSTDAWRAVVEEFVDPHDPENNQGYEDLRALALLLDQERGRDV